MKKGSILLIGIFLFLVGTAKAETCFLTIYDISFGSYDPLSTIPHDLVGKIGVDCRPPGWAESTDTVVYTIMIDAGMNSGGSFFPRKLAAALGGNKLEYNLYTDPARTLVWGDGTGETFTISGTGSPIKHEFVSDLDIFARIPAGQNLALPGVYTDAITVSVSF